MGRNYGAPEGKSIGYKPFLDTSFFIIHIKLSFSPSVSHSYFSFSQTKYTCCPTLIITSNAHTWSEPCTIIRAEDIPSSCRKNSEMCRWLHDSSQFWGGGGASERYVELGIILRLVLAEKEGLLDWSGKFDCMGEALHGITGQRRSFETVKCVHMHTCVHSLLGFPPGRGNIKGEWNQCSGHFIFRMVDSLIYLKQWNLGERTDKPPYKAGPKGVLYLRVHVAISPMCM